jgi:excinuclease ABC subunit C
MRGDMVPQVVLDKLALLPLQPGCYLFRDAKGAAIYIGKAKNLRYRVRSYFQEGSSDTRAMLPLLRRALADLDTIVVGSEKEAAILENNLIKEHRPRFNVKLRDDKDFLSLRMDLRAPWPWLEVVRRPQPDGARYFGPYPSATSARRTLHLINKHFQLRTCSDTELASRQRPCLQYQIKRCPAPCVYEVDREGYVGQARSVALFLEGRHDELSGELERRMKEASRNLQFEEAAVYRDQLRAVKDIQEKQRLVGDKDLDQDAVGLHREGDLVELAMMYVRRGRVTDTATFSLRGVEVEDDEVIGGLLRQYYDDLLEGTTREEAASLVPHEIVVPVLPEGAEGVAEWLSERKGRAVKIVCPQRGDRRKLLELAAENATHAFREKKRASDDVAARLAQLQQKLRLPALPRRIECIDISHLGGQDTVGAIVALRDTALDKKRYRTFHVRTVQGGDDYGAMKEVLLRRFRRALASPPPETPAQVQEMALDDSPEVPDGEAEAEEAMTDVILAPLDDTDPWSLPDLLVVDGGRGQLNVALQVARELGLTTLPIVGLAKERENVAGETLVDRVFLPGQKNGIALRPQTAALSILARARDEAHRFSNKAREKLGKTRRLRSSLDGISGIGPKTRKALLDALGSIDRISRASDEELLAVQGMNARTLAALRGALAEGL